MPTHKTVSANTPDDLRVFFSINSSLAKKNRTDSRWRLSFDSWADGNLKLRLL
jgi:hypothetical protein